MARILLVVPALAVAVAAGPVRAQDDVDWTGFYIGAEAGGGSTRLRGASAPSEAISQLTNINPAGPQPITVVPGTSVAYAGRDKQTRFVYGGVAGFQLQSGPVVFGVEGDVHGPRNAGAFAVDFVLPPTLLSPASNFTVARAARISYDWSARARVGYAFDRAMIYVAGGVAGARVRLSGLDTFTIPTGTAPVQAGATPFTVPTIGPIAVGFSQKRNLTGWTGGVGGEYELGGGFSVGLDGRYTDYGSKTYALAAGCNTPTLIANGGCPGVTISGAGPYALPAGTSPATLSAANLDVLPGAAPQTTRIRLNEWRAALRLIFRF